MAIARHLRLRQCDYNPKTTGEPGIPPARLSVDSMTSDFTESAIPRRKPWSRYPVGWRHLTQRPDFVFRVHGREAAVTADSLRRSRAEHRGRRHLLDVQQPCVFHKVRDVAVEFGGRNVIREHIEDAAGRDLS